LYLGAADCLNGDIGIFRVCPGNGNARLGAQPVQHRIQICAQMGGCGARNAQGNRPLETREERQAAP